MFLHRANYSMNECYSSMWHEHGLSIWNIIYFNLLKHLVNLTFCIKLKNITTTLKVSEIYFNNRRQMSVFLDSKDRNHNYLVLAISLHFHIDNSYLLNLFYTFCDTFWAYFLFSSYVWIVFRLLKPGQTIEHSLIDVFRKWGLNFVIE